MGHMADWYADIAAAAEELGYVVDSVEYAAPGRVVLHPRQNSVPSDRVTFEGIFTSGDCLRARLRPLVAKVPAA